MRIAVLGGGNGAYAAAADLGERGHEVRLWRRSAAEFGDLLSRRRLSLVDHEGTREIALGNVTADIGDAVRGAELIVFPGPAFAQPDVARGLAPHLVDGQVVFLPPGTFGSYLMSRIIREAGNDADFAIGETGTLPYLTRKRGRQTVAITRRATRLPTGIFPVRLDAHARAVIGAAFTSIERCEDALSAALMNAGPIIHPPLITMNAGPIEHYDRWDIHNEGTQPSIRRVTTQLDGERIAVREALGYAAPHFPLADHYASDGEEWMYGRAAHEKLTDSGDWREDLDLMRHRYMREDVALGLSLLVSVGALAGIDTPIAKGLLAIGGAMCAEDFGSARSLGALGLGERDPDALKVLLRDGI